MALPGSAWVCAFAYHVQTGGNGCCHQLNCHGWGPAQPTPCSLESAHRHLRQPPRSRSWDLWRHTKCTRPGCTTTANPNVFQWWIRHQSIRGPFPRKLRFYPVSLRKLQGSFMTVHCKQQTLTLYRSSEALVDKEQYFTITIFVIFVHYGISLNKQFFKRKIKSPSPQQG